jgi:hypothetical protein
VNSGRTVFSQLMDYLPLRRFHRCVRRYRGNQKVKDFKCLDQYLAMAFAQLTYRRSLRDIQSCLRAMGPKLYHMGFRCNTISRNTLANANEKRPWNIYADFAQSLISQAVELYRDEDLGIDLKNTVYALDASTIDLCMSLFPWAKFRKTKSAVKLHTLLNLQGSIPEFIHISDGKMHDVNVLDVLDICPGAIYVMDRGYLDFERLYTLHQTGGFFVIRSKTNTQYKRIYSHPIDKSTGLHCDQTIRLTGVDTVTTYPEFLRRVRIYDQEQQKRLVFLTNLFHPSAETIAKLYKMRWQVELFFKWIKQHLRILSFFGTSENAVKTQIWIAVSVYVLVAIIKKRLYLEQSLYTILQILSVTIFDKTPILELFEQPENICQKHENSNQLLLFDL